MTATTISIQYAHNEGRDWARNNGDATLEQFRARVAQYAEAWGSDRAQHFHHGATLVFGHSHFRNQE